MSRLTEPRNWTVFTFLPGSLDLRRACELVRSIELGFRPSEVTISAWGSGGITVPYDGAVWDTILSTPEAYGFRLETDGSDPSLDCTLSSTDCQLMVSRAPSADSFIAALLNVPGLLAGASGDASDAHWQGETNPNHYRMWFDGPWEHLPRVIDEWGDEIIDVSGNPGRITEVPGLRLWPAQDLWFGPAAALAIDYEAIPGLPVGRVTDLGNGRYHVRLWEDGTPLTGIRKAQQALRDHLGYQAAEDRADEIRATLTEGQPDDPMFVAQRGNFPHGGTERFLQYFSAAKHPTTRSRAAWLNIREFDDENRLVHDEYVDLTTNPHPDLS
ncbi:hypothetical protein EV651_120192 [Kribbella sp. VKM Ac-2571]|uniref:hypothetical protein n=1 Tax=Kribbella sp. VKM Ac-2571 TaxID=2512222 RepID=UPI00105CE2B5|nr:hypothetical protein [Kribbella sp. VKM Ac-2571]TDO50504.1 hypothetical protein EV651_120192 [Kribbella sp. VKM Ac-2571]